MLPGNRMIADTEHRWNPQLKPRAVAAPQYSEQELEDELERAEEQWRSRAA